MSVLNEDEEKFLASEVVACVACLSIKWIFSKLCLDRILCIDEVGVSWRAPCSCDRQ